LKTEFLFAIFSMWASAWCNASDGEAGFAVYLIKVDHAELSKVELEKQPLLTATDIVSYDWKTHTMALTDAGQLKIANSADVGVRGDGFILVADGQRCYRGAFWSSFSSASCPTPVIVVDEAEKGKGVKIHRAYPSDEFARGDDPRGDERVLRALKELGKLENPSTGSK